MFYICKLLNENNLELKVLNVLTLECSVYLILINLLFYDFFYNAIVSDFMYVES